MAKVFPLYLGTSTDHTTSKGIYRGSLDAGTGKLGPLILAAEVENPNFLALSPDHQYVHAVLSSTVASFEIRPDGMLTKLNEKPSGGGVPCHVSLDRTGRHVFVANYGDGNIASFAVDSKGFIGERTALHQFDGSGPHPERQTKSYAHSVDVDPENQFVYACDLGSDSIWFCQVPVSPDSPMSPASVAAKVPPGSGPRHLVFHPQGRFVYVANELGLSVTAFTRDTVTGTLSELETMPTLTPSTPTENVTTAEIACHPSGNWLYVSSRGSDTISMFAIAADGRLRLLQNMSSMTQSPRSMAVDPTGQWLLAAGEKDHQIGVLRIDQATGLLQATDQSVPIDAPVCILFVPQG